MRSVVNAAVIAAAILLAGCGLGPTTALSPSANPAVAVTPHASGHRTLVLGDADNGRSVPLRAGDHLQVVLSSTYWRVDGSSDTTVLRPTAQPSVSPQVRGCVPGAGCGTVTALFDAVGPGRASVSAERTGCGEAMSCTGRQGSYSVTVVVTS